MSFSCAHIVSKTGNDPNEQELDELLSEMTEERISKMLAGNLDEDSEPEEDLAGNPAEDNEPEGEDLDGKNECSDVLEEDKRNPNLIDGKYSNFKSYKNTYPSIVEPQKRTLDTESSVSNTKRAKLLDSDSDQ